MKLVPPLAVLLSTLLCAPAGLAQSASSSAAPVGLAAAVSSSSSAAALPDAPDAQTSGTITGHVVYSDTQPVAGARLTLHPASGPELKATSDADGGFVFLRVPPGAFTLHAESSGLAPASFDGSLPPSGGLDLPPVVLSVASVVTEVNALTPEQATEAQVKAEEHQRIGGVIPNFFVVYGDSALPLSSRQKLRLSVRTLVDPTTFAVSAIIAGGEQAGNSYPEWGQGMAGYSRRFAASYGDGATGIMLSSWLLPSVLHQDPRYFYRGNGGIRARVFHVLRQAVEQKGDNGHWQFAWSNTLGGVGSAIISSTYYPTQNRSWVGLTAQNFSLGIVAQAIANTLQEFVFGGITTRGQDPSNPSPAHTH